MGPSWQCPRVGVRSGPGRLRTSAVRSRQAAGSALGAGAAGPHRRPGHPGELCAERRADCVTDSSGSRAACLGLPEGRNVGCRVRGCDLGLSGAGACHPLLTCPTPSSWLGQSVRTVWTGSRGPEASRRCPLLPGGRPPGRAWAVAVAGAGAAAELRLSFPQTQSPAPASPLHYPRERTSQTSFAGFGLAPVHPAGFGQVRFCWTGGSLRLRGPHTLNSGSGGLRGSSFVQQIVAEHQPCGGHRSGWGGKQRAGRGRPCPPGAGVRGGTDDRPDMVMTPKRCGPGVLSGGSPVLSRHS